MLASCGTMPEGQAVHPGISAPASAWGQVVERRCDSAGMAVGQFTVPVHVPTATGGTDCYRQTVNLICTPR
jgi:hypothetical protein